jgi:hypothetical protein
MCFPKAQLILALANSYKNALEHIEWVECIFEGGILSVRVRISFN